MKKHKPTRQQLCDILNTAAAQYERPDFLADDPLGVPHRFSLKQDIEISAFFAAILAWGQRTTIIKSTNRILELMDHAPHQFITQHQETDRARFLEFVHRTFQATDLLYFLDFLQRHYQQHDSLETAFSRHLSPNASHTEAALIGFHQDFFQSDYAPERTRKHVATPTRGSACKRLNMYLRWMVRPANQGVDFGIWTQMKPHQLLIPLDVHVERVARELGLLTRNQSDFRAVLELTENLRQFDAADPVRYDFALFGMGVHRKHDTSI
jgi:uncharacterized protein (TIGR02757 family)